MVTRVLGTVDGKEVIFNRIEGDRWQISVPYDKDGEYVVEVIAEDEAGNRAYVARMLFIVDTESLCVHVIDTSPYWTSLCEPHLNTILSDCLQYYTELMESECDMA